MFSEYKRAIRSLLKNPVYTVVAVLTLSIGIGMNTAIFSLVNTLLFKALPFAEPQRLVRVYRTSREGNELSESPAELQDILAQQNTLQSVAAFNWARLNLSDEGRIPESIRALTVSADFFPVLGVSPILGRGFASTEFTSAKSDVVVVSESLWVRRFGRDPDILGRVVRINGNPVTIIGVMPSRIQYPLEFDRVDAWVPVILNDQLRQDRSSRWLQVIGRLKSGISFEQVQADFSTIATRLAQSYPTTDGGFGFHTGKLHDMSSDSKGSKVAFLLLGLSGFVLLIACANLANLQLARNSARARDLAVRGALGASRSRLIMDTLSENIILALFGGGLGLLFSKWVTDAIGTRIDIANGTGLTIDLDGKVLFFTLSIAFLTGVLFGLLPALSASKVDLNSALKQQSRGATQDRSHHRVKNSLIIGEVGLTLVLLAVAGFFLEGLRHLSHQETGWNRHHLLVAGLPLFSNKYGTVSDRQQFYHRLESDLQSVPGVENLALGPNLPLSPQGASRGFVARGQPLPAIGHETNNYVSSVSRGYFNTLQLPLLRGGDFTENLTATSPLEVVVNESLAKQLWPSADPIGQQLAYTGDAQLVWRKVVGVVRDINFPDTEKPNTSFQSYLPLAQTDGDRLVYITLRAENPLAQLPAVRAAMAGIDPDLPLYEVSTADEAMDRMLRNYRLIYQLLGSFAVIGLLFSALGIYGVIASLVTQRTSEFGIRSALGAQPREVLSLVLSKGMTLVAIGTAVGLAGGSAMKLLGAHIFPEFAGGDTLMNFIEAGVLLGAALLACWLPARRAMRLDPLTALRAD